MATESVRIAGLWQLLEAQSDPAPNAMFNVMGQLENGISAIGKLMFSASECEQYPVKPETVGEIGELLQLLGDLAAMARSAHSDAIWAELEVAKARIAELEGDAR